MKKFIRTFIIFLRLKFQEIKDLLWWVLSRVLGFCCIVVGAVMGVIILSSIIGGIFIGFVYTIHESFAINWILHACPDPFDNPITFPFGLDVAVIPGLHVIAVGVFLAIFFMLGCTGIKFIRNNWREAVKMEAEKSNKNTQVIIL